MRHIFHREPGSNPLFRQGPRREVPADMWVRCEAPHCREMIYVVEFERNLKVCPKCGHHARLSARDRIAMLVDGGSFQEMDVELQPADPLNFVSAGQPYTEKLAETQQKTGLTEAAISGRATIEGIPVVMVVLDFAFLGASMGTVVGEKVCRAAERAAHSQTPLVIVSSSGGARMHEGVYSLMQMAKTAAALERLGGARVPYISVLTDPTTGGVTASFAGLGDVMMAEPGALVGFAGPRVIEQTTRQKLPPGAQSAEFLLEHGMVDMVVHRRDLRPTIARLLRLYASRWTRAAGQAPAAEATALYGDAVARGHGASPGQQPAPSGAGERDPSSSTAPAQSSESLAATSGLSAWDRVKLARHPQRPYTLDYVRAIFSDFVELHGDRHFGDDPAVVGGLASLDGRTVMVIGHQKGRDARENALRRFGMARPEGIRKALRLMKHAEKFGFPVITLIDIPGADPSLAAEERGQAFAIAENLRTMAGLGTFLVACIIGEGGSGGALAMAVADRLLMLENAIYTVASPEASAAILWRDASLAPMAAEAMKITAPDLLARGIVDRVVPEPPGGAHTDPRGAAGTLKMALLETLQELEARYGPLPGCSLEALREDRYRKHRAIGLFSQ